MFAMVIGALAAATLVSQPSATGDVGEPAAKSNVIDPLLGQPMPSSDLSPERLYAAVRREPRDALWAAGAEEAIRGRYSRISHVGNLRVVCASSLCEVAGTIDLPTPTSKDENSPEHRALNNVMRELQDQPLRHDLAKSGLKQESAMFTSSADKPPRSVFFTYYSRAKS